MTPTRLVSVLILILPTLPGVETRLEDLRFGFGIGEMPSEQRNAAGGEDAYGSSTAASANLSGTLGLLSPLGVVWGGELRYLRGQMPLRRITTAYGSITNEELAAYYGDSVPDSGYTQAGAALHVGLGWAVSRSTHVELVGLAGFDWLTLDRLAVRGGTASDLVLTHGRGMGTSGGGRLGVYYTRSTRWQFGLTTEYVATEGEIRVDYSNGFVKGDIENRGFNVRASLGYRF